MEWNGSMAKEESGVEPDHLAKDVDVHFVDLDLLRLSSGQGRREDIRSGSQDEAVALELNSAALQGHISEVRVVGVLQEP